MKKFIAMAALLAVVLGPAQALAVDTSLTRGTSGGEKPIVKVKWEMNGEFDAVTGEDVADGKDDNLTKAGAQFDAEGAYQEDKDYSVCGIVTDPDGVDNINAVYGDVWYPEGIYLGDSHEADRRGCGQMHGTECKMTKLDKAKGLNLFCNLIKNGNPNLPTWADLNNDQIADYNYAEVCAEDGELMKETAYVYCCNRELSYEDPDGSYKTLVFAQDKAGNDSNFVYNQFQYVPLTAFETDFNAISYGSVQLNTHKIISGDLTWNTTPGTNNASVRNVGNTRLSMNVNQNDMGLGMTGTVWNVKYDGRVGSNAAWANYVPTQTKKLADALDLSEMDEMDFSILISKFPPEHPDTNYSGTMTLTATRENHLSCATN